MSQTLSPSSLSIQACAELGVNFPCSHMENGEYRFRCVDQHGYGYALTKMPPTAGNWQNSHFHKSVKETYVVQAGWMGFASLEDDSLKLVIYTPGQVVTTEVGQAHNVYLPAGAVIHTVKHGDCSAAHDWFASPGLDNLCKKLNEQEIIHLARL